jgi:hypothetical protein
MAVTWARTDAGVHLVLSTTSETSASAKPSGHQVAQLPVEEAHVPSRQSQHELPAHFERAGKHDERNPHAEQRAVKAQRQIFRAHAEERHGRAI